MKIEYDCWIYLKMIELFFYDEEIVGNFLREISFGYLGLLFENEKISEVDFFGEFVILLEEFDYYKIIRVF